jgi:MFS family permease
MIADLSTHENRGHSFGIMRMMDNLGAVAGICFTILLVNYLGLKTLFLIASIPSAIAVLVVLVFVKEKPDGNVKIFKGLKLSDLTGNLRLFFLLSTIFALASFSYSFLLIYAKDMGFKIALIPVFYLIYSAVASISSLPFGMLSDRIGRKRVLQIAFFFWALVCATFILCDTQASVFAAFIFYGLHKGSLDTVQKAFVAELAPKDYRASVLGGFQMVIGLVALPASLIAGLLWDIWSPTAPFFFSLGLTAVAVLLLPFVKESHE